MGRWQRTRAQIEAAREHRSVPMQLFDLLTHRLFLNIKRWDYYNLKLYRKDIPWQERSLYVGFRGSRYWPWEGNSLKSERLFACKSMQKAILTGLGLPTPRVLARVGRNYPVDTRDKFLAFMSTLERPVVTKPDGSLGGNDVMVLEPAGDAFRRGRETLSAEDVWRRYEPHLERGFLIEEKVANHPVLDALHPGSLNTMRVVSIRTRDGRWHLPMVYLRVGRGDSQVDNSQFGGIMVPLDADGVGGTAWDIKADAHYTQHPDTGAAFVGLRVPMFREALALVRRACSHFGFMTTIGWDVAVTPEGPALIEGNAFWNPRYLQGWLGPLLTPEIAAGLPSRHILTPWDKTHMYPGYRARYAGGWLQRWHARRRARA
jgi:hypothetical protein